MLKYLTLILTCQLVGEFVVKSLSIPVPGPLLGMVLLFLFLLVRGSVPQDLNRVADGLLSNLSLLFVPAGVGVMLHFSLLGDQWLPITIALVVSTTLTIAVTACLMTWLSGTRTADGAPESREDR